MPKDDGSHLSLQVRGPESLLLAPLPSDNFCSGHLVWVQRGSNTAGCMSVHATFTEYGDAGKRWRFLESGLWGVLPRAYFEEGRYLTFVPPAAPSDPIPCVDGVGCGEDPTHGLPHKRQGNIPSAEGMQAGHMFWWHVTPCHVDLMYVT